MAILFQEEVHSHLSERQKQKQTLLRYWKNSRMITSERILKAFMEIPREYFVETSFADQAYADHPLPIGEGQTISQPTTVMLMLQLLEVEPEHRVLEIGAGCGYNAALLGLLAKEVVTIERHEKLAVLARANLRKSGISNVGSLSPPLLKTSLSGSKNNLLWMESCFPRWGNPIAVKCCESIKLQAINSKPRPMDCFPLCRWFETDLTNLKNHS